MKLTAGQCANGLRAEDIGGIGSDGLLQGSDLSSVTSEDSEPQSENFDDVVLEYAAVPPPDPEQLEVVPAPEAKAQPRRGGKGHRKGSSGVERQSWRWRGYLVSKIFRNDEHIGFGITCARHSNEEDGEATLCQKALLFGREHLSHDECILRLKKWLLAGVEIGAGPRSRSEHVAISARALAPGLSDHSLARFQSAAIEELACRCLG